MTILTTLRSYAARAAALTVFALPGCTAGVSVQTPTPSGAVGSEILWDTYGVPHIFAENRNALAYAWGWAQMQNHGDLLLRLYSQARGRAAETLGQTYLTEDRWVWTMGIPQRSQEWLGAQSPAMREHLTAFVRGINAFAEAHPELVSDSVRGVLPVAETDPLGHAQRLMLSAFVTSQQAVAAQSRAWEQRGSNAWAIGPSRSASGHALLLANPHLPWGDLFTLTEAQFVIPGVNLHGAAVVGSPVLLIAFNDRLGWTLTVNTQDGDDLYELTLSGEGYQWDGSTRPFDTEQHVLRVRQPDGTHRLDTLSVRRSVHGPVVAAREGRALALRVVGPQLPGLFDQLWNMATAQNLAEFRRAIEPNQISTQNITYADADGRIMYFYGGNSPVRATGDRAYWSGIVPGTTSANLWTRLHGFADMPFIVDPATGWLQNANNPPWWTTFPPPFDRSQYPPYLASLEMSLRAQQSAELVESDSSTTLEEMIRNKHSTEMELANRILPDLLSVARSSAAPQMSEAADVLSRWDRRADAASTGAVLFVQWANEYASRTRGRSSFAQPWSAAAPRTTPQGIADTAAARSALEVTVQRVIERYGSLAVPWGDVYRLRRDTLDLPSNGASHDFGVFRLVSYRPGPENRFFAASGDSYVAAVEFGPTVRAYTLIGYGNASRAGSPHRTDQLGLFSRQELKPVLRTRAEIERNLLRRERF